MPSDKEEAGRLMLKKARSDLVNSEEAASLVCSDLAINAVIFVVAYGRIVLSSVSVVADTLLLGRGRQSCREAPASLPPGPRIVA